MLDFKTQKALKLQPETVATQVLDGENIQNLLDFVDFLQTNDLKLKLAAKYAWEIVIYYQANIQSYRHSFKILRRLRMDIENKTWSISLDYYPQFADYITSNELKNFVWSKLYNKRCALSAENPDCICGHGWIVDRDILGKKFDNMCCNEQIKIINPSAKELEHVKVLIMTTKLIVENEIAAKKQNCIV